jgi:hypothetical protein
MTKNIHWQNSRPGAPTLGKGEKWETFLQYKTPRRQRLMDLRYILSKIKFEPESWNDQDVLDLLSIHEWLMDRCLLKKNHHLKEHSLQILTVSYMLKSVMDLSDSETKRPLRTIERMFPKFLLTAHQYFGLKNSEYQKFQSGLCCYTKRPLHKTPQPYIGVGYKDKGTLRCSSSDGCPSWKEVAISEQSRKDDGTLDIFDIELPLSVKKYLRRNYQDFESQ